METDEVGVETYLRMMKEDAYVPTQWDFLYLLGKLDNFQEVTWLKNEFQNLGKQPTKKMLQFMIYFTRTVEECLGLAAELIRFKVKHSRKMGTESAFSTLYILCRS